MNTGALLRIAGLRYRLLWANVRSKRGKVILFSCGYLLVIPIAIVLLVGGIGSGLAAIRSGKAELVAGIVLGVVFLEAILIAVILGIGSAPAFSDAALRRYPLSRLDRLGARQLTAFLEPIWLFVFALDLGVAVGFYVFLGAPWLLLAVPAAILLVVTNFLLARVLSVLAEWIVSRRSGALVILLAILLLTGLLSFGPFLMRSATLWKHGSFPALMASLQLTPPLVAARIMVGAPVLASFWRLLALLLWCFISAVLLVLAEGLPSPTRTVAGAEARWNRPYDRLASAFGPVLAPLVGKTLRYYVRSPQLWLNYPVAPIACVAIALMLARGVSDPLAGFLVMLGVISVVGFLSMGAMPMNAFGFDRSGFRRYFLFPVAP
ncbi:MAG TPA: hypothetical protein VMW54_08070, partial [Terriglobia bacterium]|nr:hypothetical protein [Terriglobia bacterium]